MTDSDLEQRLRRALAARAEGVTAGQLRPIVAPRQGLRMRWWLPLSAGLAAAAVVTLIFLVVHRGPSPGRPIAPVGSAPAPVPSPSGLPDASVASAGPSGSAPVSSTPSVPGAGDGVPNVSPSAGPGPSRSAGVGPGSIGSSPTGSRRLTVSGATPPAATPGG